jgi:DNA-binding MarR family transcriptional regulator
LASLLQVMRFLDEFHPGMEMQCLMVLLIVESRQRKMHLRDLVEVTGLAYSSVSRNLHKWRELGVVDILEDPDDHRYRYAVITGKGRLLLARIEEMLQ